MGTGSSRCSSGSIRCGLLASGKRTLGGVGGSTATEVAGVELRGRRVGVVGTLGGDAGSRLVGVVVANISASCWMAFICSLPRVKSGEAGAGLRMAQQRSMAALMAASAEER